MRRKSPHVCVSAKIDEKSGQSRQFWNFQKCGLPFIGLTWCSAIRAVYRLCLKRLL